MQLGEHHLVRRGHPHFAVIDQAALASKNLYNQATYQIRQAFIHEGTYLPYAAIFVTSARPAFQPLLINGCPLKSLNQYDNKQRARHQRHLAKAKQWTSRQCAQTACCPNECGAGVPVTYVIIC